MNDELVNPVAKIDEALAEFSETLRFRAVAGVLGRDVSPRITPAELLMQLGDCCPGEVDVVDGELAESTGHRGGCDGTAWQDQRPCTPRGDRKALFAGNVEAVVPYCDEVQVKEVS